MTTDSFEIQLFNTLRTAFSLEDLRTVCFLLGLDHDSLRQDNRDVLAREMVDRCRMSGRLPDLRDVAQRERPNLDWPPPSPALPRARVLVVDPLHRGDYPTISEAMAAASPGDRIEVRPGVYHESLVIDKPLEIVGQGPVDAIIVHSGLNVIRIATTRATIRNLTLRQTEGNWHGLAVHQGHAIIENCVISGNGWATVAIYNGAMATVHGNRILSCQGNGIVVYDQGQGMIANNEITGNRGAGIVIKTGSNPTVYRNHIYADRNVGILVCDHGQGTVEYNEIVGHARANIVIETGGNPKVRQNVIRDGQEIGILVRRDGQGIIESNDIIGNGTGVAIETKSNPILRHNQIHNSKWDGIVVIDEGQGIIEDNDIVANGGDGLYIHTGGNPIVHNNRIHHNRQKAIRIIRQGAGTFEYNDLSHNGEGAWLIGDDSQLLVQRLDNAE